MQQKKNIEAESPAQKVSNKETTYWQGCVSFF